MKSLAEQLRSDGYTIVEGVLNNDTVQRHIELLGNYTSDARHRGGLRNLLAIQEMRELACSDTLMALVCPVLGEGSFPVRGILFDKHDGANWKVPWHQDVTIAVKSRLEFAGYGPWSMKEGVMHVQPPGSVLEGMVSVRLHLDDCPASNGALRVIVGSHIQGKLDQSLIPALVPSDAEVVCEVKRGGALLMSPLTIHASSASKRPGHRRVIHFDYANADLGGGLEWFEAGS